MYTALRLSSRLRRDEAMVTVIDPLSYMTYQPFLPEAAAGNLEPRHVVVPLRRVLPHAQILNGRVTRIEHGRRVVTFLPNAGRSVEISYDIIVVAPGSIARTLPIPGLAENGIGFKTVGEAIFLRNHVLSKLDIAASTKDVAVRKQALTFVFVGGGYAGVEAMAELEDMARDATKSYDGVEPSDMRWVLVEASDRILPEVSRDLGVYTVNELLRRNIEVRLGTRLNSAERHHIVLSDGDEFEADTLVWTAGVKPNPLVAETDFPLDDKGPDQRHPVPADRGCRRRVVRGRQRGDSGSDESGSVHRSECAARSSAGAPARRQHRRGVARRRTDRVPARVQRIGREPWAAQGRRADQARGVSFKVRGWPAWFMHRTYHLSRVPTFNRKVRVAADWTLALFFHREIVSLGALQNPHQEFALATKPGLPPGESGAAPAPRRRRPSRKPPRRSRPPPPVVPNSSPVSNSGPRSPTGRGEPLKRVSVSVRLRPGAPRSTGRKPREFSAGGVVRVS